MAVAQPSYRPSMPCRGGCCPELDEVDVLRGALLIVVSVFQSCKGMFPTMKLPGDVDIKQAEDGDDCPKGPCNNGINGGKSRLGPRGKATSGTCAGI